MIIPVRVFFKKTGRLKYISHLDLMTLFMRCLIKAKVPVRYTEGFNPIVYISFPLPLSLGYEGMEESVDIRLNGEYSFDKIKEDLNTTLPEDIRVISVGEPINEVRAITSADYTIKLYCSNENESIAESFSAYINQEKVVVLKKTKRGMVEFDVAPYVKTLGVESAHGYAAIAANLATGLEININPRIIINGFLEATGCEIEGMSVTREKIYNNLGETYR